MAVYNSKDGILTIYSRVIINGSLLPWSVQSTLCSNAIYHQVRFDLRFETFDFCRRQAVRDRSDCPRSSDKTRRIGLSTDSGGGGRGRGRESRVDERPSNVHPRRSSRGACIAEKRARVASSDAFRVRFSTRERERQHVERLACGKCRNVRNKTLAAGSGRCCCAGPPLRSTMGTVGGSTPSCPEILEARDSERVPGARVSAVRRAHTVTHTQQGRPRPGSRDSHHRPLQSSYFPGAPFTPTFFAPSRRPNSDTELTLRTGKFLNFRLSLSLSVSLFSFNFLWIEFQIEIKNVKEQERQSSN